MSDSRNFGDKRHRGGRGGVKKRMGMNNFGMGSVGPGPLRSYPRPQFMSSSNSAPVPYGMHSRLSYGPLQTNANGKYGFFDGPQAFGPPGYEKRSEAALKSSGFREGMSKPGIPPLMRPPAPDFLLRNENGQQCIPPELHGPPMHPLPGQSPNKDNMLMNEPNAEGINELFAKMVWKKLDLIKDPVRLARLHIEIMNILQMAVAEESAQHRQ